MASAPVVAPAEVLSVAMCSDVLPAWAPDGLPEAICPEDQRFTKTVFFMRWAFDQQQLRQVHDIPEHTLVVGWREAKPCAEAIEALRTGDTSILRPDSKRAPAVPVGKVVSMASTRRRGSSATPIRRMVIMVNKGRHRNRALKLASELSETVEVHVVSSMEELTDALVGKEDDSASTASSDGGPVHFGPPPGLEGIGVTMEMSPPPRTMPPQAVPKGLAEAVGKWLQNVAPPGLEGARGFSGGIGATAEVLLPPKMMPPTPVPEGLVEAVAKWHQNVPPPGLEGAHSFSGGIGATTRMFPHPKMMPPPSVPECLVEAVGKWLQNVDLPTAGPLFALEKVLPIPSKPTVHGMLSTEPLRMVIGPRIAV